MNDSPFNVYDGHAEWTAHQEMAKPEAHHFRPNCVGYVSSPSSGDNFAGPIQNYVESYNLLRHQCHQYPQHDRRAPYYGHMQQQQRDDSYHSPVSYFDGHMDSQVSDDFEYFPRDRCHTWPSIQQRPAAPSGDQQEESIDDQAQHQLTPPTPSRTSSALSLISESNESLAATPTSTGTGIGSAEWTVAGFAAHEYSNYSDSQHSQCASSTNAPVQAADTSKRTGQPTPTYKSGHPSYVELITQAILSSPEKRMTLSEIYDWMVANVPSFKHQRHLHSSAGWKNSVRHNLSLHARFKRVKRNGMDKPSWWTVDLSEEAKRDRTKRPRQSRPRANTTTGTSRECQAQRQQNQRQANVQSNRTSLAFAQPYAVSYSDHASSGHGSMTFSGSITPASSVGSDIFSIGAPTATSAVQCGSLQQRSPLMPDSLMPPPMPISSSRFLSSTDESMLADGMEWAQFAGQSPAPIRSCDQLLDPSTNAAESANLQCLSQAIAVSLRDPPVTASDCAKSDVALATNGQPSETEMGNYLGTFPSGVSTLVHALRENTIDDSNGVSASTRQMVRIQTSFGTVQEVSVPVPMPIRVVQRTDKNCQTEQRSEPRYTDTPSASYLQTNSPNRGSSQPSPASSTFPHQQQLNLDMNPPGKSSLSPGSQQRALDLRQGYPNGYGQHGNLRKDGAATQLPDDLATLDVGGLDCNIMDVLSYEMNCGSNNAAGFA